MKVSETETHGNTISEAAESTEAATATSLLCHCHITVASLSCHYHVTAVPLSRHCHATAVEGQVQDSGSTFSMFDFMEEAKVAKEAGTGEGHNGPALVTVEIESISKLESYKAAQCLQILIAKVFQDPLQW